MRLERLVIEAGENTFTLDLHPRLTVVAGMGQLERDSLIGEIVGALGGSRSGVHVELEERSGRHLAVFRPDGADHRIIDVDAARDVTAQLSNTSGACDLLEHLGLTAATAQRAMRLAPGDLATRSDRGRALEVLAGLDQGRVWAAAEALVTAEDELASESRALGTAPEDAAVIDLVEERHSAVERATNRFESTRKHTFYIGGVSTLAALPAVIAAGPVGLLLLGLAAVSIMASLWARARMLRAGDAEVEALAEAGAQTYLGFQLQRVNSLIGDDRGRATLMGVAHHRRDALTAWHQLAGDIPVEWALENRAEVQAAAQMQRGVDALEVLAPLTADAIGDETTALAQALVARLAEARSIAGEGVPLLLDDPFGQLDAVTKLRLLEVLGRSAGDPQIIFLTEDADVASWARLEALAGEVSLIEPHPEHAESQDHAITL